MKPCISCGIEQPLTEFYAHKAMKDGRLNKCKSCVKRDVMQRQKDNPDAYRARHKSWRDRNKDTVSLYAKNWVSKNPVARSAHVILNNAIKTGCIEKPKFCEECGAQERLDGHHEDYSLPLVVRWLCRKCHKAKHS